MSFIKAIGIYLRHQYLIQILFGFAIILLLTSCTGRNPVQDVPEQWGQQFLSEEINLSFSYPDNWSLVSDGYRNNTLTIQLKANSDDINLVVTALPVAMGKTEIITEMQELLSKSLYNLQSVYDYSEREISGREIVIIDAAAGKREQVLTRTAAFSDDGRTYVFTVFCNEESHINGMADLELILASVTL